MTTNPMPQPGRKTWTRFLTPPTEEEIREVTERRQQTKDEKE
jgi:hypothetical protein